ncbi:MAG TPA: hypothetical protein PLZ21_01850, partial [Armatimonadota bacterium]|nr:hypothetical protein [Armatimonadota bacterium]
EPEKEQTQGRQEEGSAIKITQNEMIYTLMSHDSKLKSSSFHTHFVLEKLWNYSNSAFRTCFHSASG